MADEPVEPPLVPRPEPLPAGPLPISPLPVVDGPVGEGRRLGEVEEGGAANRDPADELGVELAGGVVEGRVPNCASARPEAPKVPASAKVAARSRFFADDLIVSLSFAFSVIVAAM